MVPISDFKTIRISFDGKPVDPRQRRYWWDTAQRWQQHLLTKSGAPETGRNDHFVKSLG